MHRWLPLRIFLRQRTPTIIIMELSTYRITHIIRANVLLEHWARVSDICVFDLLNVQLVVQLFLHQILLVNSNLHICWLPVTPSGCRVIRNHAQIHYTSLVGAYSVSLLHTNFPFFYHIYHGATTPPPGCRIVIVGFLTDNNGCSCALHPFGCGNIMVLQSTDGGLGMHLRIRMIVPDELACFAINPDGSDGC